MTSSARILLQKDYLPFAALSASYFAHVGFFNPYLSLWLQDLGLSVLVISLLNALPPATRMVAPYAWGWLADRSNQRMRVMRCCASLALLGALGLCWQFLDRPWGLWWLVAMLLLLFLSNSAIMPMTEAAISHLVSRGGGFDARRYGLVRLCGSVGFLATVLVGGAWFEYWGLRHFPFWSLGLMGLVVLSVWRLPAQTEATHHRDQPRTMGPVLRRAAVRWFFASVFFHVLSHISVYVFFSLYMDQLGYSKPVIGALWAASVIIEIAWFYFQSRWMPRLALAAWLVLCALVCVLRMGITASMSHWLWLVFVAQALHAITFAAHHTTCVALLTQYFPGILRSRGQALYVVVAYGVPGVLGAILGGLLVSRWGLSSVFWAAALASALAAGCAWQVWRLEHRGAGKI